MPTYKVLRGNIKGMPKGSNVELTEKEAKQRGERYVSKDAKAKVDTSDERTKTRVKADPAKKENKKVEPATTK